MLCKGRPFLVSLCRVEELWLPGFLKRAEGLCRTPCTSKKEPPSAASTVANQQTKTQTKAWEDLVLKLFQSPNYKETVMQPVKV